VDSTLGIHPIRLLFLGYYISKILLGLTLLHSCSAWITLARALSGLLTIKIMVPQAAHARPPFRPRPDFGPDSGPDSGPPTQVVALLILTSASLDECT
jgi:hypothetical protein